MWKYKCGQIMVYTAYHFPKICPLVFAFSFSQKSLGFFHIVGSHTKVGSTVKYIGYLSQMVQYMIIRSSSSNVQIEMLSCVVPIKTVLSYLNQINHQIAKHKLLCFILLIRCSKVVVYNGVFVLYVFHGMM